MAWKVMVSAPYFLPVLEEYQQRLGDEVELIPAVVNERLSEAELLPLVGQVDGIICGDDRITEKVLDAAPKLKVISKWGTGIDSIDKEAANARGVAVCRTPNAFSEPVADTVLGYMLLHSRQFVHMNQAIRAGGWEKPILRALNECTLGVVGVGDCGKAIVRRAVAFGMTVLGCDIKEVDPDFLAQTGVEMLELPELLGRSDYVTLNCDLNPSSFHLMNHQRFGHIKPGSYLINASRGPVVEEAALVQALKKGLIDGVALDVFEDEPLPPDSGLRRFYNVLFAPHNANSSPKAWQRVHDNTVNMLLAVLRGDKAV